MGVHLLLDLRVLLDDPFQQERVGHIRLPLPDVPNYLAHDPLFDSHSAHEQNHQHAPWSRRGAV